MADQQFKLSPITAQTKGEMKRLRKSGFIPVSIQHKGSHTVHLQQESKPLDEYIRQYGEATLLDVIIPPDNKHQRVIVQSLQRDALTHKLMQVTFQELRQDDKLKTHVAIQFQDEPPGANTRETMVQHLLDRLEIECAPTDLPDHITVSLAGLVLGEVFRVSDLVVNPHYKILTPADMVLASFSRTLGGVAEETTAVVTEEAVA